MHMVQKKNGQKLLTVWTMVLLCFTMAIQLMVPTKATAYSYSDYVDQYGDFLDALGQAESGNDYSAVNGQYLGRWQIGPLSLQEVGFLDAQGNWTELAASYGIYSRETFLTSPEGQDYAVLAYHKRIWYYAQNMGLYDYIGQTVSGLTVTCGGIIVGSHALGIGGMQSLPTS